MKICPHCRTTFADEFNYCLQDGTTLVSAEYYDEQKTLSFAEEPTLQRGKPDTAKQNQQTYPQNYSSFGQTGKRRSKPLLGVSVIVIGLCFLLGGVIGIALYIRKKSIISTTTPTPQIKFPTPLVTPKILQTQQAKLKVDVMDKVKGSFGRQYLKCLVTNVGETVASNPSVSVQLYKDDVKLKALFGRTDVKYLKPQQTIPIWIDLFDNTDYTKAVGEQGFTTRAADKTEEYLFPNLIYTETKMTSKKGTSLYNYKPYTETFYSVSGIVENQTDNVVSPDVYVFFYNDNKEIIGISRSSVSQLKKGEKGKFEIQEGDTKLFGTPTSFEIFAVND